MATIAITGGRLLDATGERAADVLVGEDGRIAAVGDGLRGDRTLDAGGCVVVPGFVDLHTHLRQPGEEEAETIDSGARAAALGGYTCILAMPNTTPAIDHAGIVREVLELGRTAPCDVATSGAITVGRAGEQLAPLGEMADLGVRFFTDDGAGVADARLMRRAMEYAAGLRAAGRPVTLAQHCEDPVLAAGGHMHEGEWSARLGIPGQPAEAEELMVLRDLALARLTGTPVHLQHLSTARSVAMVQRAKADGVAVTCEATTHHLTFTHAECAAYDPVFKVNPPLRTEADVAALRAGLADGAIDCIATDHAPHTQEAKEQPFDEAPPGMLGLETALAVALTELDLPLAEVVALLSWRPARILGVDDAHGGPIEPGRAANLAVVDPEAAWVIDPAAMASRSRNTPYAGRTVRGRVRHTLLHGEPVVIDGEPQR